MSFLNKKSRRGLTFIGAVVIAIAFLIAIMLAISWILSSQRAYFTKPNMVTEKAESYGGGNTLWLEIKNYGMTIATLKEIYVYDTEAGKYYIAYPNGTIRDPVKKTTVGSTDIKPLSASEGEYIYAKLIFDAGVLRGNLITGVAVFDKTLAPWKLYRLHPPVSQPGYTVNAWRVKLFIFNPSDFTIFTDNASQFLAGTVTKKPIAVITITKNAPFAGHFFNWSCGLAKAYGWVPGSDVVFSDAYRNVMLPFYRYYFNCTSKTAVFIVYLENTTIFPRQTYPIYMWYAPYVAGGGTVTVRDYSNETVYYMAVNNSFQDLFRQPPAWDYDNGLRSRIAWVRDYTADSQMSPGIFNQTGIAEDLNVTDYADWQWDGSDHIYCTQDPADGDYQCSLTYLNLTDGFFERFDIGAWKYYMYPEGYTWLFEVAFNMTHTPPQVPFNQTYILAMTTQLQYLEGWWWRRWWSGGWYGWISKTFGATAANWAIITSTRSLDSLTPPDYYTIQLKNVENIVLINTSITVYWRLPDRAFETSRQTLALIPTSLVNITIYNDTNANIVYLIVQTNVQTYNFKLYPNNANDAFRVLLINTTGGYIKVFVNAWTDTSGYGVVYYDYDYPPLGRELIPSRSVRTYYIWPRYFGVWWIASKWIDTAPTIWTGRELEASLQTTNLSKLNFSIMHRLVYSYTSGADLVGTQFVWMGIASEGNSIDDDLGNPPPLEFITAEASGAYGDELIEGNTVTFSVVDTCWDNTHGTNYYLVQVDWARVIIGLGYIWWEGPVLDQWPWS